MFLTGHVIVGMTIGHVTGDPITAFFTGWLSHYFFDILPHGDEKKFKGITINEMGQLALIDHAVAGVLAAVFLLTTPMDLTWAVLLGIIGAVLPDWLMAVYKLMEGIWAPYWVNSGVKHISYYIHRAIRPLQDFHNWTHYNVIRGEVPFWFGTGYQVVIVAGIWLWL